MRTRTRETILLYREMPKYEGEGQVDIVLTPQLYFMKHEEIPLRFAFQARKIAPSVLEEFSRSDKTLRFEVAPDGEGGWYFFAYDPTEIESLLQAKGVLPRNVGSLYFAQQLARQMDEKPLTLPASSEYLTLINGIVAQVPESFLAETQPALFRPELVKESRGFSFRSSEHHERIGRGVAVALMISLGILGTAWLAEGLRYRQAAEAAEARIDRAADKDPRLASSIVRKNIREKYLAIDRRQRKVRNKIRAVGSLVSKEIKLNTLRVDSKGYKAQLQLPAKKLPTVMRLASEAGLSIRKNGKAGQLIIEEKW